MKATYWILLPLLFSTILMLVPRQSADACVDVPERAGYDFIDVGIAAPPPEFAGYFLRAADLFADLSAVEETELTNLQEWQQRVCVDASLEEYRELIYRSSISTLEQLRSAARSKEKPLPMALRSNAAAEVLAEGGCDDTVDYLIFAKTVEPHVTAPADAWEAPPRDLTTMQHLIDRGTTEMRKARSHYIKMRYAYQVIRLAHYMEDYRQAVALYENLLPKFDPQESIINHWILGHYAGALMGLGQTVEASYLFSKIFISSPGKRESAFRSFRIETDEEWRELMLRAESDEDRANLHVLRANERNARALEEMEAIYRLKPDHRFLPMLLVKELEKLEDQLLGAEFNDRLPRGYPERWAQQYAIDLQKFARRVRSEGRVRRPELWQLAEGYLELLAGDYVGARNSFEETRDRLRNDTLRRQLDTWMLVLNVVELDTADRQAELLLYDARDREQFARYESFADMTRDKLVYLYRRDGMIGKAFLASNHLEDLRYHAREDLVTDLFRLVRREDLTRIEELLIGRSQRELDFFLSDLQAVRFMQEGQFEAALRMMKRIPRAEWDRFGVFDPFVPTLRDCISCAHSRDTADLYNRGELLEKLLQLESRARAEPERAARDYFSVGVALWNMTYFGHSWNAMDYFRSGSSWNSLQSHSDGVVPHLEAPFGNREYFNVQRALYYFERARLLANSPEVAAAASIWAAKCELILYFGSAYYERPKGNQIPRIPEDFTRHYRLLKEEYPETDAYARMIRECRFFDAYVRYSSE